jgi:endonuclease-3
MGDLIDKHDCHVPGTLSELTALPGVGRKTANVVLGNAFGVPGITVDTHVGRLAQRIGLSKAKTADKIEKDLMELFAPDDWIMLSHTLIFHGRRVCLARKPRCDECPITSHCNFCAKRCAAQRRRRAKRGIE